MDTGQQCPTIAGLLAAANRTLATNRVRNALRLGCGDPLLLSLAFPDWDLVDTAIAFPPRALLRHKHQSWWLLVYSGKHHRLLPGRDSTAGTQFRFSSDSHTGNTYVLGSDDDIINYVSRQRSRAGWALDPLAWTVARMPGTARADAEHLLLALGDATGTG